jgi:hypothetical protein
VSNALKIVWFSTSVGKSANRSPDETAAYSFLAALKGGRVEGESIVPVGGKRRVLNKSNSDDAIDWFGEMAAGYLDRQSITPPLFLIPLPGPETTLESSRPPWTSLLAMAIASKVEQDVAVLDLLRWKKKPPESGLRQPMGPEQLFDNLAVTRRIEREGSAILVGYLARGAAPLQACAAALKANGTEVVLAAFAGRIVSRPPKEPFAVMKVQVPDFAPPLALEGQKKTGFGSTHLL